MGYLGFYQAVLTPASLIMTILNCTVIIFIVNFNLNKKNQLNQTNNLFIYISFQTIMLISLSSILVFSFFGFFSLNLHYELSWILQINPDSEIFLPYYLMICFFLIFFFFPFFFTLMRHSSVSERVLKNLVQ